MAGVGRTRLGVGKSLNLKLRQEITGMSRRNKVRDFTEDEQELVATFTDEVRRVIHSDHKKAMHPFKTLLLYIEKNLTDPNLKVSRALKASNLNQRGDYSVKFFEITGMRPGEYIEHHKVKLAQKIVRNTRADLYHVAFAVGYTGNSQFSRSYKKVVGYPPSEERIADLAEATEPRHLNPTPLLSGKAADPKVSMGTAEVVIAKDPEHVLDNDINQGRRVDRDPTTTSAARGLGIESFWGEVENLDHESIKYFLLRRVGLIEVDHFHLFLEKSKYAGRVSRARGEELALAALDSLRVIELRNGVDLPDEKAIAYANLGNLRRMQFNLDGAGESFRLANRFLPCDSCENPILFAQVKYLEAVFLWWRRDVGGAINLIHDTLPIIRRHGPHELLARALQLAGEIPLCAGYPERALPLFMEAVTLTQFIDDPYVVFSANFNLTFLYAKLSKTAEATALIEKVQRLYQNVEGEVMSFHLLHLRGLVCRINNRRGQAESLFLEAREGFLGQGQHIFASLVSLELSLLYLEQQEPSQAFSMAVSAIPAVAQYSAHKEAITALAILQEAETRRRVDRSVIKKALHHLELVRKDPTANFVVGK